MLIDDIDFARLYRQQLRLARRTEKCAAHWDARAEKMAAVGAGPADSYLRQLLEKIDFTGARSLFDMGCGPGTVSLAVADRLQDVHGVDYSRGMLTVAARRAEEQGTTNAHWYCRSWEESWDGLPVCDIAVASRSTLVGDMRLAMDKLSRQARLRIYTTHLVSPWFMSPQIQRAAGRDVVELPNYIYALNVLYQMGIHASVDFIRGPGCQQDNSTFARFLNNVTWTLGALNEEEHERLQHWYQKQEPTAIAPPARDWALISWTAGA